jgi:putative ABC transport system substrate-binding protein
MRRRDILSLLGGAAVSWPVGVRAQQAGKVHRIGFLANDPKIATGATGAAFLEGLRENGFVEGQNIIIERRFTAGRDPELGPSWRQHHRPDKPCLARHLRQTAWAA